MKKVLSVLAVVALILIAFTSCKSKEKTYADYLTQQTKGWVLESATSSPDYVMSDGKRVADIYNDYLYEWEQQYVLIFNENSSEIVKPGKVVAPDSIPANQCFREEKSLGNWSIMENVSRNNATYDFLNMYIPFVFHQDGTVPLCECQIITLDDKMLKVKFIFNDDQLPAKGNYEWTLTYVPVK